MVTGAPAAVVKPWKLPPAMAGEGRVAAAQISLADLPPFVVDHEEELVSAVVKFGNSDGTIEFESVVVPLEGVYLRGGGVVRETNKDLHPRCCCG